MIISIIFIIIIFFYGGVDIGIMLMASGDGAYDSQPPPMSPASSVMVTQTSLKGALSYFYLIH